MIIGIPKEIKKGEYRVGLIPSSVRELIRQGHKVIVETGAGMGIGFDDDAYRFSDAVSIASSAEEVFGKAEMIVKVKEPQPSEYSLLRENQILFTYLHLAPDLKQTEALLASGCVAIAYETVTDHLGRLPLLTPMSEVAGRFSIQAGAFCLQKNMGGKGILLGSVAGVRRANILVIGGGVVGTSAIRSALGYEAHVTVLDKSLSRLRELDQIFDVGLTTIFATDTSIEEEVLQADLVIGAVLVPGGPTPKLVRRDLLRSMQPGSVIVDVSIDQGGCFETSRPTSFDDPSYIVDDVVHYCVANMPGAVPKTASYALNNATLPFIEMIANKGYKKALLDNPHLLEGLNVYRGHITYKAVADAFDKSYRPPIDLLTSY